jgi:hypothetical protein
VQPQAVYSDVSIMTQGQGDIGRLTKRIISLGVPNNWKPFPISAAQFRPSSQLNPSRPSNSDLNHFRYKIHTRPKSPVAEALEIENLALKQYCLTRDSHLYKSQSRKVNKRISVNLYQNQQAASCTDLKPNTAKGPVYKLQQPDSGFHSDLL